MRVLILALLFLATLPAWADGRGHPHAAYRDLAAASQRLDFAATRLYRHVEARFGRSEATAQARALVDATRTLDRQVERRAPARKLNEAYQRVERRQLALERTLLRTHGYRARGPLMEGLHDVARASARVERALERQYRASRQFPDHHWARR